MTKLQLKDQWEKCYNRLDEDWRGTLKQPTGWTVTNVLLSAAPTFTNETEGEECFWLWGGVAAWAESVSPSHDSINLLLPQWAKRCRVRANACHLKPQVDAGSNRRKLLLPHGTLFNWSTTRFHHNSSQRFSKQKLLFEQTERTPKHRCFIDQWWESPSARPRFAENRISLQPVGASSIQIKDASPLNA